MRVSQLDPVLELLGSGLKVSFQANPCTAEITVTCSKITPSGEARHTYTLKPEDMIGKDGQVAFVPALRQMAVFALKEMNICTFEIDQEPFVVLESGKIN
ncbi:MAG: hypothetical protein KDC00_14840 [Flavobacteriales bacterium]|nr:hypothetical protein [Flavobacteriales bacterium]